MNFHLLRIILHWALGLGAFHISRLMLTLKVSNFFLTPIILDELGEAE